MTVSADEGWPNYGLRGLTKQEKDRMGFIGFLVFIAAVIAGIGCFLLYLQGLIDFEMLKVAEQFVASLIGGGTVIAAARRI